MTEPASEQIKDLHVAIVKYKNFKRILFGFIRSYIGCRNINVAKAYAGFTLAEVLITLSIIGVVAALTIPSLVVKNGEKELVVRTKEAFSILSQAYGLTILKNGETSGWNINAPRDPADSQKLLNLLAPQLNLIKNCGSKTGCFPNVDYNKGGWSSNFENLPGYAKAQTSNGMLWALISFGDCENNSCGGAYVEVNGPKGPNKIGEDMQIFFLGKNSVLLNGTTNEGLKRCKTVGDACSAWIVLKGNFDYLHSEVSWGE